MKFNDIVNAIQPLIELGAAVQLVRPYSPERQTSENPNLWGGKAPYGKDWQNAPVASLADLEATANTLTWVPNVGVRLGEHSRIDNMYLHALDVDIRTLDPEALHAAEASITRMVGGKAWRAWPRVASGSNGVTGQSFHLYVLFDRPHDTTALDKSQPDWDIVCRGNKTHVVLPPSNHKSGGQYRWEVPFNWVEIAIAGAGYMRHDLESMSLLNRLEPNVFNPQKKLDPLIDLTREHQNEIPADELRKLVMALKPARADNRKSGGGSWDGVGMIIKSCLGNNKVAFNIFDEFSIQSKNYNENEVKAAWKSFKDKGEVGSRDQLTLASLRQWVKEDSKVVSIGPEERRFRPKDDEEVDAKKDVKWLIKDLMQQGKFGMIYGPPGAGKSFFILHLLDCLQHGLEFYSHRVKPKNCLYICAEDDDSLGLRKRAYKEHYGRNIGAKYITAAPNLLETEDVSELINEIKMLGNVNLIIIDTMSQCSLGADENSSVDMGRVFENCRLIHSVTGAMVIVIHHTGKDISKGYRGWTGFKGFMDVEIEIVRNGEQRSIFFSKVKNGKDNEGLPFILEPTTLGKDEDGDDITSAVYIRSIAGFDEKVSKLTDNTKLSGPWQIAVHQNCLDGITCLDRSFKLARQVALSQGFNPKRPRKSFDQAVGILVKKGMVTVDAETQEIFLVEDSSPT